jgi:hypothetical protein
VAGRTGQRRHFSIGNLAWAIQAVPGTPIPSKNNSTGKSTAEEVTEGLDLTGKNMEDDALARSLWRLSEELLG